MRHVAAVDIGGTTTKVGLVDEDGRVVARATIPTSNQGEPEPLVDAIVGTLQPMLRKETVSGLGVSVAGFLDHKRGAMILNANLPLLCGFPLRRELAMRLDLECRLEVDSNASTIAEFRFGAGRGAKRLLGVTIGTGLGGGVIVDGALLRHTGECAGDLGHVIVSPKGRRCSCGANGCLEAMVNSAALSYRAGGRRVRDILSDARAGEQRSLDALAETGWWLGLGLASLAPLFAPDRIVVGGGVAASGDFLLEPARMSFLLHAASDFKHVEVLGSSFDGWEGLIGAGSLALEPLDDHAVTAAR